MRVYVSVPQTAAPSIKVGQKATLAVREFPNRTFTGEVAYTARALTAASRTMLVEIHVPNADDTLMPGMFAQVTFHVVDRNPALRVRSTSLLLDANGTRLPIVDQDDKIALVPVTVGADDGTHIEILTGITAKDRVAVSQLGDLAPGTKVDAHEIASTTKNPATMPTTDKSDSTKP